MMGVFVLGLGKSAVGKAGKAAGVIRKGDEILVSYGKGFWGARTIDNQVEQDED